MNNLTYMISKEAIELLFSTIMGLVKDKECPATRHGAHSIINHVKSNLKEIDQGLPTPEDTQNEEEL